MSVPEPQQPHPRFEGLKAFHYNLIMADPPWNHESWSERGLGKSPQGHYDCMRLDLIKAMPVHELAWKDCVLWLWATNPMLPQAFEVLDAWGFKFCTAGHWVKRTVKGNLAIGTGRVLRCSGEPFLIGTLGKPATARNVRSVIESDLIIDASVREHSRKPDACYEAAERLRPGPKADLFSRQSRPHWDNWGNEKTLFDQNAEAA